MRPAEFDEQPGAASPASTSSRGCSRTTARWPPLATRPTSSPPHEWPRLYDEDVLRANEVPVAAAIYTEDLYVERAFSEETAARDARTCAPWVTSEYDHNGLRADGERILARLIDLVRGRA